MLYETEFFHKYWWILLITIPAVALILWALSKKFYPKYRKSGLGFKKGEVIGPSLICLAMIFNIIGRPLDLRVYVGFTLACASLVIINITYIKLYNKAKQLIEKKDEK